mmetsp:Transcript_17135/g.20170  ORF Transcript_17135/g.20170 Transcript_17135/m.20170 type:complete len:133 (+) Transcript_17135:47-445(+)
MQERAESESDETHPLFLTSCPRNEEFDKNATLSALVALIDEEADDNTTTTKQQTETEIEIETVHHQPFVNTKIRKERNTKKVHVKGKITSSSRAERRPQQYTVPDVNKKPKSYHRKSSIGQAQICLALTSIT